MPFVTYTKGPTSDRHCKQVKNEQQAFLTVKRWMAEYVDSCVDFVVDKKDVELLEEYWGVQLFLPQLIQTWNRMFYFQIEYFPNEFVDEKETVDYKFPKDLKDPSHWE